MAEDADKALKGEALFFTEGGRDIGEDEEGVGDAVQAEGGAADGPADVGLGVSLGGGEPQIIRLRALRFAQDDRVCEWGLRLGGGEPRVPFDRLRAGFRLGFATAQDDRRCGGVEALVGKLEEGVEMKVWGGAAEGFALGEMEGGGGGGVEEAEAGLGVEGEDGGGHGGEDALDEGEGVEGGRALVLEGAGEGVDFEGEVAEGVAATGSAGSKGEVVLAEGGNDVGESLEGARDPVEEGGGGEQGEEGKDSGDERGEKEGVGEGVGEEGGEGHGGGGEGEEPEAEAALEGEAAGIAAGEGKAGGEWRHVSGRGWGAVPYDTRLGFWVAVTVLARSRDGRQRRQKQISCGDENRRATAEADPLWG